MKYLYKILIFLFLVGQFIAQPKISEITQYANDYTNTLNSSQLSKINQALEEFENQTSNQIVLVIISTTEDYTVEQYAYELAAKNKIGSKENNNGVLFLIAKNDKKMRIEVGYGLEGVLTDALSSSILRNEVQPYFRSNDFESGIISGLNAIMKATQGEYKGTRKKKQNTEDDEGGGIPFFFIVVVIIFFILKGGGKNRGGGGGIGTAILLGSILNGSSGRSSGGGFGGFSGGGGFGGFSGGGGSFGGGGSSGSW